LRVPVKLQDSCSTAEWQPSQSKEFHAFGVWIPNGNLRVITHDALPAGLRQGVPHAALGWKRTREFQSEELVKSQL